MGLTDKQDKFAQLLVDGLNQTDAYKQSYVVGKMKAETIYSAASKLAADYKVATRVKELREAVAAKLMWTREQSVAILADIARDAEIKASEKVSAIKELNSMHGYNAPTKTELAVSFPREIYIVSGRAP